MASQNDDVDEEPKKNKVLDMVLAAFRKEKPPISRTFPDYGTQVFKDQKLEPRGAREREASERDDLGVLRKFLAEGPKSPEETAKTFGPKSGFDWDDDEEDHEDDDEEDHEEDHEEVTPVKVVKRKYKWQTQHSTMDIEDDSGESRDTETVLSGDMSNDDEGDDEVNLEAGKSSVEEGMWMSGRSPGKHSISTTAAANEATDEQDAAKSARVMEMYGDPLWSRGYQMGDGDDRAPQGRSVPATTSLKTSSSKSSSVRAETKLSLNTDTSGTGFKPHTRAVASTSPHGSLNKDSRAQYGPMQVTSERKSAASPFTQMSPASPQPTMASPTSFDRGSSSKALSDYADSPSFGRQGKAFQAQNASCTSFGNQSRRHDPDAANTNEIDHSTVSKFFERAKRSAGNRDRSIASGNAFAQEEARKLSAKPEDVIYTGDKDKIGENLTLCYSDSPAPTPGKIQRIAEKFKISPTSLYKNSPTSTNSEFAHPLRRGMPAGPWEPDWDHCVKWTRKEIKKRQKREAKEAREAEREMKKEDERLEKLNAGKDAIKRQSLVGMIPKKQLEDITEDEFELLGEAAMVADECTPTTKSNLLNALFTKMPEPESEQKRLADEIGHTLDHHPSLQMLNTAHSTEQDTQSNEQYNETLRMLEGETPIPTELVNPFAPPVGLGISSPEQEELATRNRMVAKMTYEEFAAVKAKEAELRAVQQGFGGESRSPTQGLSPETAATEAATTREEFDREPSVSPSSDRTIRAGDNRSLSPSVYSTDDVEESEDPSDRSPPVEEDFRNYRSGVHRYYEDDAISIATIESTAIPEPLNVQKPKARPFIPKDSNQNIVVARPTRVPILHVSQSSQHLQPSESRSFIPRRNTEFRSKILEQSRVQANKIGSHPALRAATDTPSKAGKARGHPALRLATDHTGYASKYSNNHDHDQRGQPMTMHARVDSGIGTAAGQVADEGYGTGNVGQQEFARSKGSPATTGVVYAKRSPTTAGVADPPQQPRRRKATLVAPDSIDAQQATGIDLSALRREVGLDAAQLPGPGSSKHPNHPFTWHHEKVMCHLAHNPLNTPPPLPGIPENQAVNMSPVSSKYFSNSPGKGKIVGVKMCASCSSYCCRFAHLVHLSKMATNKDVTEEHMRMKAEQRVEKLRAYYPNGIEEYDNFVTCLHCTRKVCPSCATKCMEQLCQAIICADCAPETGVCPVHDGE